MRLFIAINLDKQAKDYLWKAICRLREQSATGSFTAKDNLHLTLAFIGETNRVRELGSILDGIECPPFGLTLSGFGRFPRREGDVCWIGVEDNPTLQSLHNSLYQALTQAGFPLEDRPFRPHLTLGRRVRYRPEFSPEEFGAAIQPIEQQVASIHLMESTRVGGRLAYLPKHTKHLIGGQQ